MTLVVNIFGGPGSGKSTLSAELFVRLKKMGINCEYITEYAKDKTWEESKKVLENQIYIFGKQQHRMFIVADKVNVMICDSPLLLTITYGNLSSESNLYKLVLEEFNKYSTVNVYLDRSTEYVPIGRNQSEDGAIHLDNRILSMLEETDTEYSKHNIKTDDIENIIQKIKNKL